MPRLIWAFEHGVLPEATLHPNRSEDSIPMITASFPAAITRRACAGLSTIRNHPRPVPPAWAST